MKIGDLSNTNLGKQKINNSFKNILPKAED